ncbi:MAG: HAD family phosphatase [Parachlamydiales bacterium]|nr:HAD family phosphatase [Parachlamydiales bacterium]
MKMIFLTLLCNILLFGNEMTQKQVAVVFDFGGVLTHEPNKAAIVQFLQDTFALNSEEFEQVNLLKRQAVKMGKTDEEFWLKYAEENEIQLPENWAKSFKTVMKDNLGANPRMFELVSQIKETNTQVALFSNIDQRLANLIREFGFYDPFDPCILSCEIMCKKPDPEAYAILIERIGLPPEQIIFIDDKLENIEAARALGIDGIHFQSVDQIKAELSQRKVVPF